MKDSFKQVPQTKLCRRPHGRLRKPMLTARESPKTCQRYPARMLKIPTKELACIFCSFSDSPKKTAHSPCLLSQVVWTVRVPPRFDLAVFRDSHAGKQSLMKHSPRTVRLFALPKNLDNLGAPALAALAHAFQRTTQAACNASTACLM